MQPLVKNEDLVRAWEESESIQEVAKKLGIKKLNYLSYRAYRLRACGVKLKSFKLFRPDVKALNKLVDQIRKAKK